jgi:hypothetical protein
MLTGTIWHLIIALGAAAFSDTRQKNPDYQLGFDIFSRLLIIGLGVEKILLQRFL